MVVMPNGARRLYYTSPVYVVATDNNVGHKKEKLYQVQTKYGGIRYMTGEELKKMGLKYED